MHIAKQDEDSFYYVLAISLYFDMNPAKASEALIYLIPQFTKSMLLIASLSQTHTKVCSPRKTTRELPSLTLHHEKAKNLLHQP
jgi:hypothetical protein